MFEALMKKLEKNNMEAYFVETKEETDEVTGQVKKKENLIFPRYHQLDVIRKTLADLKINKTIAKTIERIKYITFNNFKILLATFLLFNFFILFSIGL